MRPQEHDDPTLDKSSPKVVAQRYTNGPIKHEELIRLMLQHLRDLGYDETAKSLELESGHIFEAKVVSEFRDSVLGGNWTIVESLLPDLGVNDESKLTLIRIMIKQQKYLELLQQKDLKQALIVLRSEIAPLIKNASDLHELSSYMMCSSVDSLKEKAKWTGLDGDSRATLLTRLQSYIPSSLILPDHRLETLLEQSKEYQKLKCVYHNAKTDDFSLFVDHKCNRSDFPCVTTHVFEDHTDEVWFVAFSHNGEYLASASKDRSAIIRRISDLKQTQCLTGHDDAVSFLAWSPDDKMLLTCSNDTRLILWDVAGGSIVRSFSRHVDAVTSCAWLPSGDRFVSSSLDKTICLWNVDGSLQYSWNGARVTDLAINNDGSKMVAICHDKKIRIYDLNEKSEIYIQEDSSITSLCLDRETRFALVNVSSQEVHLWDLLDKKLIHKYVGQKQGRFVIRSCFGGVHQNFIVSGSEDGNVYVWHREFTSLIEVLSGHTGTVNSVTWNPANPSVFASASDDYTVRLWGKPNTIL